MESEKIKKYLEEEIFIAEKFEDTLRRIPTRDLQKILTLINGLEKENEELKQDLKKSIDMQKEMLDGFKTATKEVEENLAREIPNLLKQFAERLKEKCEWNRKEYCCEATISARDIDEICKELIEL